MPMSRRDFVRSAAGIAAVGLGDESNADRQPAEAGGRQLEPRGQPVVVGSGNAVSACEEAMKLLQAGGDPVDAVVSGVSLVESDPNDHTVGYGGLPNEDGVVELDACVMHGPTHKAGAVAALRNIRNPSQVAKLVMQRTDHVLLVGEGALRFAKAHGFKEEELLTDEARQMWLKWKETLSDHDDWLSAAASEKSARRLEEHGIEFTYGTITCLALTRSGDLGGCTSTSGLSYKMAGRVGDSPILGAGLYVDNQVGACGSTGRGEANLLNCSCFHIVELMRGGMEPEDACKRVLQRIADRTEPRLRDDQRLPNYGLTFYALRRDGRFGGATMRGGKAQMAVHDGQSCRLIALPGLYPALPEA